MEPFSISFVVAAYIGKMLFDNITRKTRSNENEINININASAQPGIWNKIITAIKGQKIAVFGARGTGKTTLFQYLGMVNKDGIESSQTVTVEKTRAGRIQLEIGQEDSKKIKFQKTYDVPGSEEIRDSRWLDIFNESDVILYLVNAYELLENINNTEIKKRIEDDLQNLREWNSQAIRKRKIFIIGNHFDRVKPNFGDGGERGGQLQRFEENEIIKKQAIGMTKIIGSLKTRDAMKKMMEQIVNQL